MARKKNTENLGETLRCLFCPQIELASGQRKRAGGGGEEFKMRNIERSGHKTPKGELKGSE